LTTNLSLCIYIGGAPKWVVADKSFVQPPLIITAAYPSMREPQSSEEDKRGRRRPPYLFLNYPNLAEIAVPYPVLISYS
jgi:hypothetical protein